MSLLAWIKRVYRLLLLLAAIFGVQPGKLPMPTAPQVTPPAITAPPAPAPGKKTIGQCHTGDGYRPDGSRGFYAVCIVDGASFTLPPGDFPTRTAAQQAIAAFRTANP